MCFGVLFQLLAAGSELSASPWRCAGEDPSQEERDGIRIKVTGRSVNGMKFYLSSLQTIQNLMLCVYVYIYIYMRVYHTL